MRRPPHHDEVLTHAAGEGPGARCVSSAIDDVLVCATCKRQSERPPGCATRRALGGEEWSVAPKQLRRSRESCCQDDLPWDGSFRARV